MAGMYGCFKGRNSDSAAMASGPPDVMANQEPAEVVEECSGKKKSKFQTFKKFFARKKRKEPPAAGDAGLKASQSIDNVSKTSENNTLTRSEKEKGSGSKVSLGGKALSHDSVFVSDSSEANEALGASQDSIHGKVKSLQHQLRQAIRLGSPPSLICVKKTDDGGAMSEDDSLPCSPPECTTPHSAMNQAQRNSSISLEGADSDNDQLSCPVSSRTVSPLVVPGDFSLPASPFGCLDNSAAKHKLGLRHKACNRRKPVSRLELKAEGDSVVEEILNTAEAPEEEEQQKITEVVSDGDLKPKVDQEEEEEGKEEEEKQHSTHSLSRDEEESEEAEERADPDVSHGLDSSSPPEQRLSEEEDSQSSSRASSLDSPGATLEPPADPREYLLDPPGIAYGTEEEKEVESDLALSGEEDGVQENRVEEEESSFLQEVLSSLKTPLASCSLTTESEGVILEQEEEAKEMEREDIWVQEVEEVKEEEPPTGSFLSDQTTEEEEEVVTLCQDVEEEEEAATSMHVSQHDLEEEGEDEEVEKEDEQNDVKTGNAVNQAEEEEGRGVKAKYSEEEEEGEAIEQEVEQEEWEKREEVEETEEAENAIEEETDNIKDVEETSAEAPGEDDAMQPPKDDEAVEALVGDVRSQQQVNDDETESQDAASQSFSEEKEEGEKEVEEGVKVERRLEQEEDREADQPDAHQSEHVQQEDGDQSEATDQDKVPSKPPPLSLPESQCEDRTQDSGPITPSKTSTTTIHINLLSPSSKKALPFFQQSLNATQPEENQMPCCAVEQNTEEEEEEEEEEEAAADKVEAVEAEGQQSAPPASTEVNQPTGGSAQSNTWLRSLSVGDPEEASKPPVCVPSSPSSVIEPSSEEKEVVAEVRAESACPAQDEEVLSPSRVRSSGTPTTPSPSTIQPQASAAASTEESSVVSEGNPDNPFGVRLRKTSALQRFSSEEENTETPIESPTQPTSCRVDSLQLISVNPSINQPISNKPVIPKKPDVHGDSGGKIKRMSDPAAVRGVSVGSDSPSWISVAKQKQRIYKENSLDEITVRKEEPERKSSLPMYVSSAASRENSNRTAESTGKVSPLEIRKPSAAAEKEVRRALSPPTPVPPQPPKPHLPTTTTTAKPPSQPNSPQRSLSPPIPLTQKIPSCTSPPSPSKTPQSTTLTSPPFSSRPAPGKSGSRAAGLSSQTPASQRGLPPPALSQDEPPWMALAKKKAKAWSEMPQIVQ